jgi:signal transduction histidine kinase/streptogramin lyase
VEDTRGNLWVGGIGTLLQWQDKLAGTFPLKGLRASDTSPIVEGLAAAKDNSLWAGIDATGAGRGLERFAEGQWKPFVLPTLDGSTLVVMTLFLDRDNALWVGTENRGIYRIRGKQVDHFSREDGLSSNTVTRFYQDHEGDIWVTTSRGVDAFRDRPVVTFSSLEGLAADYAISVVARRDGTVWAANLGSLDSLRGGEVSSIRAPSGLPGRVIGAMLEDHAGRLWVSVDGGIFVYGEGHFRPVLPVDTGALVIALAEDTEGSIWAELAGPSARLVRIQNFQVREEILPPKIPPAFTVIADPHGGVWISLFDGDLAHYEHGHLRRFSMDPLKKYSAHVGGLYNLLVDSRTILWGAAAGGLVGYKDEKVQLLTEHNGLPCNFIYSVVEDNYQNLWLNSQCGLVRIERPELQKWWENPDARIQVQNFDPSDGALPGSSTCRPAAARSPDGRLWFVNGSVLQMIDPSRAATDPDPPPVYLEKLVAAGRSYPSTGEVQLAALPRDIEIDYTALSYVAPQKIRFRYKLEGRDAGWQDPGTRRQAFYTDLPPGKYRFRVIASNGEGVWNDKGAALDFSVAPAWFQTRWFLSLCVLSSALLILALYRLRVQQIQKSLSARFDERLAERTRMARELHDTFLQTLQGSKLIAEDAVEESYDPVRMRRAMEQLLVWLGQAVQEGRAALNSLRTSTTQKNDLAEAFARATEECQLVGPVEVSFSVTGHSREMHPVVRDELYRIGYEAIRNACTHSRGSRLEVCLKYGRDLAMHVKDNGIGLEPAIIDHGKEGHFGLQGMRERVARIGGKLTVASAAGSGTEITVVVPGGIVFREPSASPFDRIRTILRRVGPDNHRK